MTHLYNTELKSVNFFGIDNLLQQHSTVYGSREKRLFPSSFKSVFKYSPLLGETFTNPFLFHCMIPTHYFANSLFCILSVISSPAQRLLVSFITPNSLKNTINLVHLLTYLFKFCFSARVTVEFHLTTKVQMLSKLTCFQNYLKQFRGDNNLFYILHVICTDLDWFLHQRWVSFIT